MFKAITAHSIKTHSKDIINDLIKKTDEKLGIYRPSTGIFYASSPHETEILKDILSGISEAFPGIEVVGGTVIGGFTDESGYTKDGYFLCLIVSDTTKLTTGCIKKLSTLIRSNRFSQTFCAYLGEDVLDAEPTACLIYSAYNNIDGDKLIDAVQEVLPEKCQVFGGIVTDYWDEQDLADFSKKTPPAEKTLLFFAKNGAVHVEDDSLVFLLLQGNLTVKYGVSYGWSDVGMLYPARGDESILTEIDGKNTHTFLRELKHPLSMEEYSHTEYSLWIHVPGKDPHIRDIFFDNVTGNYYTQGASLPSQFQVSFSFPKKEKVLKEFQNCLGILGDQHNLVVATTCCTHQVVLGQDISQEHTEMVRRFQQTPIISGYFFGEFGPSITNPESMLHSCSSILVCLQETDDGDREREASITAFLDEMIEKQRDEIKSLQKQLKFFEGSKNNKMKMLNEDCLGMLLCRSHKSLSSHAEQISKSLKAYYKKSRIEPPYAISRNRLIEHLMILKKGAEKFLRK